MCYNFKIHNCKINCKKWGKKAHASYAIDMEIKSYISEKKRI